MKKEDCIDAARALRQITRKTVKLPTTGVSVEITKLTSFDFIERGLTIPSPSAFEEKAGELDRKGKAETFDEEKTVGIFRLALERGVVSPRVVISGEADPDAGEINVSDLGEDLTFLVSQIIKHSAGDATFREEKPEDDGAHRPAREEVQ